jgi:signal transduction histidine kinase
MATVTRTVIASGTTLAEAGGVTYPSHVELWRGHRNRFYLEEGHHTARWTTTLGIVVHSAMLALLIWAGYPLWRIIVAGGLFVAFSVFKQFFAMRVNQPRCIESSFIGINCAAQLFVVGSAAITGGVYSPFLPNLTLSAVMSLLFFGPIATSRWIAVGNALLVVAMAVLPGEVVGPPLDPSAYTIGVLLGIGWNLLILHRMAGKLAVAAERTGDSYVCLREDRLVEAEAQLRRLQSVGAKVAHELKNPLASIKGLCQLVARAPESERTLERLGVVEAEICRMQTILDEYLSFSRPLEDLKIEAIDLAALARDVLDVLAGRADHAGVALSLEGGPTPVHGDPRRLKEALINLVANAIEATPSGGAVGLRVRTSGDQITLEVKDTGRGISPEDLERLGTSFFTTRPNGTGLGVVLAQGVITQHGGTLAYTSTVGHGTAALITLPGKAAAIPEPAARAAMVEARA